MARDGFKSKLVEKLQTIAKGAPSQIGFGPVRKGDLSALILLAMLPRNDPALARAAIDNGIDAVALRLHGQAVDGLEETGDLAAERANVEAVREIVGDVPLGVVVGTNGQISTADLE